ncbi:MAG: C4-type zinc ribbon domain-containing protein [Thermoanaerobaculum sp.]|nr:C4-type zinc ribbon domain-containing protein [Thermoanaerobaculum sp.]
MDTRSKLQYFATLQKLLDLRRQARQQLEKLPDELLSLNQRYAERRRLLQTKEDELARLRQEQAGLEGELETLKREREHFRRQKSMVTNMRQLQAVVNELDQVEGEIKKREERLLAIWQQVEGLEEEVNNLSKESEEERLHREALEAAFAEQKQQVEKELERIEAHLRQTQRLLGTAGWEEFKKLWATRKPTAVVPMDGDSCSACHAQLRPSLVQLVKASAELAFCDSCRRLLYDRETIKPLELDA